MNIRYINFLYDLAKSNSFSHSSGSLSRKLAFDEPTNWHRVVSDVYLEKGAVFATTPGWRNVLGMRRFTPVGRNVPYGNYNDHIVAVWSSNKGESLNWELFEANTDPSYQYMQGRDKNIRPGNSVGEDANQDGKLDLGLLPPGIYQYHTREFDHPDLNIIFRPVAGDKGERGSRVFRDIDRDGHFTNADEKLVKHQNAMYERNTMYIHGGGKSNTYSAGCQTMRPTDFKRFKGNMKEARDYKQLKFTYLLLDITNM